MSKLFTVLSVNHTRVAPDRGAISWMVAESDGTERKISAVTTLSESGEILKARAIYARETPLVNALLPREEGDCFNIDFTQYNLDNHYREREVYSNMKKNEAVGQLGGNIQRILLGAGLLLTLWLGWTFVKSVNHLAETPKESSAVVESKE